MNVFRHGVFSKLTGSDPGGQAPADWRRRMVFLLTILLLVPLSGISAGQQEAEAPAAGLTPPERVEVEAASDPAIAERLEGILESTGWFEAPSVAAREGVVFIDGRAMRREYREWAGQLAANTEGVAAVVNRLKVERSPWDFSPALEELRDLWQEAIKTFPLFAFAVVILAVFLLLTLFTAEIIRRLLGRRGVKPLLRDVGAKAAAIPVFLVGLYIVLKVSGLSRLALTVLGGTGIAGLVIGIAFRDILENFLASILISTRNPFKSGDLIEIEGRTGVVQKVTTRGTVLMDFDGNHVQIPNATIYKSTIINYTANPRRRMDFTVGIGYEDAIGEAQTAALATVSSHPAVLADPEPLVLVESLGAATVNLRVYFWFDGIRYNGPKIRSSLIRRVKRSFMDQGISMPDEAREIVFPRGVPVRLSREEVPLEEAPPAEIRRAELEAEPEEPVATAAEGALESEEGKIREQARTARVPEEGEDLL